MKTFRLFSMAAVALMMGACSSENDIEQAQQLAPETGKIHFEATLAAPNAGDRTRTTITEGTGTNADKLFVAWKGGELIALVHNGHLDQLTVGTPNLDGSAPVTGTITALGAEGEAAKLVYPYAGVASVSSGTDYTPNMSSTFLAPGFNQDGTLAYIGNNDLDGRVGEGILKTVSSKITIMSATEGNVKMESRTAIWKLTLTTDGTTPLVANQVSLSIGGNPIAATALDGTGKSEWTLVLVPATIALYSGDFTITAAVGTNTYTYTKAGGITLVNGKYYQSTVTMAGPYKLAAAATSSDKGKLICTDGHIHASAAPGDGCSATRVAMITYVGNDAETSTTYNHGLALALADASTNATWCDQYTVSCPTTQKNSEDNAKTDMAGIANTDALVSPGHTHTAASLARGYNSGVHPTGTSAWFLPSAGQWDKMLGAGHSNLDNAGLANTGFWSSTEYNAAYAWRFVFDDNVNYCYLINDVGSTYTNNKVAFTNNRVRACLAF